MDATVYQDYGDQDAENRRQRTEQKVKDATLPGLDESVPSFVHIGELLAVLNTFVEFRERFSLIGEMPQPRQHCRRILFFRVIFIRAGGIAGCRSGAGVRHRLVGDELFQCVVLAPQLRGVVAGLFARGFELALPVTQGKPGTDLCTYRRRGPGHGGFRWLRRLVLRLFMLLERALECGVLITSLASQVLLRILEFILFERELRLRQFHAVVA